MRGFNLFGVSSSSHSYPSELELLLGEVSVPGNLTLEESSHHVSSTFVNSSSVLLTSALFLSIFSRSRQMWEVSCGSHLRQRSFSMIKTVGITSFVLLLAIAIENPAWREDVLQAISSAPTWYMDRLDQWPVLTKSVTTAVIQFMGDYVAQIYENYRIQDGSRPPSTILVVPSYDFRRGVSLAADGMFLSGPLLHYAFDYMETILPTTEEGQETMAAIMHVLANDYLVDSIYLFLSFIFVALAEGHVRDLPTLFRKDFFATLKASWGTSLALIPVEFVCFRYLSVSFRVLAMNFIDVLWGAIISFVAHRSRRISNPAKETQTNSTD